MPQSNVMGQMCYRFIQRSGESPDSLSPESEESLSLLLSACQSSSSSLEVLSPSVIFLIAGGLYWVSVLTPGPWLRFV